MAWDSVFYFICFICFGKENTYIVSEGDNPNYDIYQEFKFIENRGSLIVLKNKDFYFFNNSKEDLSIDTKEYEKPANNETNRINREYREDIDNE